MGIFSHICPGCDCDLVTPYLSAPDRFHGRRVLYCLLRCNACGLVWLDAPPGVDEMPLHYGQCYDQKIADAGSRPGRRWLDRKRTLLEYKQGGAILDLGCSNGSFLRVLGAGNWALHGIEISSDAARIARASSGAKVFIGDILDAQFNPCTFDVITCFHVLEHFRDPRQILQKIYDWLKPGGIFYLLVPNIDSAGARIFRSYWYALELPRHLFHYSPRSLSGMAQAAGLDPVTIVTHRELFLEESVRYIIDELFHVMGIARVPLSEAVQPSIPFRLIRKTCRLSILPLLAWIASFVGAGESIHAVFNKKEAV